ncbi:hypothetical protein Poli38472_007335 [Pythium oligandrum]|uniref:Major facilitator superfamily (MFS) profile domain-containing protein n=1 Tax=Pythium oligandrum TaxID=41045 RepID=A0A8K1FD94_PYTOL|nr:hypothetical protein Poli38472_007335 [Pythium oligandrum]|eukprot:TMW59190.1 hypothetical protein Poli38472_007335 [Pythium oligandrum]
MAFSGWQRITHNVKNTYVVTFFLWAARSILFQQIISGYVFVLTNSNKPVGVVKGIQGISQLVFSLPAGYFADKTRRDTILKISGAIGLFTTLLTFIAIEQTSLGLLYVAFGLWGMFAAFQNPAMEALFADSIPHGQRSFPMMIKYNISNLAMVLGPALCVLLFVYYGDVWQIRELTAVLEFGTLLMAIAGVLLFRFNDDLALENEFADSKEDDVEANKKAARSERESRASVTSDQPLRTPSVVNNEMEIEYDYSDDEETEGTDKAERAGLLARREQIKSLQTQQYQTTVKEEPLPVVKFWCFNSTHVPWLIFASDFIISNGAGMTINFFPLFFKEEYGLTPIHVSILFLLQPILVMVLSYFSQKSSKRFGRMPIIVSTRIFSLLCLFFMSFTRPLALQVVLFLMRGGMMRCSQPLRRSILMDHVPKEIRARWNALEGLSVFSWSGSAVLGGFLIDSYGYRMCFLITSLVYTVGLSLELFLLPLTKHAVEK